jgi:hypothetical protein
MIKHFHKGVLRVWHTAEPSPCAFMSQIHFTNQHVSKPVSEQTVPINTCKIDTVETRKTFEINHVIMGPCFQAAQDGRIDSDVSFWSIIFLWVANDLIELIDKDLSKLFVCDAYNVI